MKKTGIIITLIIISVLTICNMAQAGIPAAERAALIEMYNSTGGANWTTSTNWLGAAGTECSWYGVTCDAEGNYVTEIDLHSNQLAGSIPAELGSLSSLTQLSLNNNQLTSIPAELGSLSSLTELYLSSNQLTSIPAELGSLSSLTYLRLNNNQLTSIPAELGSLSSLTTLYLNSNQLTSIPAELGSLSSLTYLNLYSNQLTGIPAELGSLASLTALYLSYNAIYTTDEDLRAFLNSKQSNWENHQTVAPTNFAAGTPTTDSVPLTWRAITFTSYTGGYEVYYATTSGGPYTLFETTANKSATGSTVTGLSPDTAYYFRVRTKTDPHTNNQNTVYSEYTDEISATTAEQIGIPAAERNALIELYNSTDGPNWSSSTGWLGDAGTECTWYGVTCEGNHVTEINLNKNKLVGTIPASVGDLSGLLNLSLNNDYEPDETNNNQLAGSIPKELGSLTNLRGLYLFRNQLSENIPKELGNLSSLIDLGLQDNQLSGSIPPELGSLTNLQDLRLHTNQLTGSIPPELGSLTNLTKLWLGDNQLTGTIPSELGNLINLTSLGLSFNQLDGAIPEELGDLVNLTELILQVNELSGTIPPALGNLGNLTVLHLNNNLLTEAIPPEFGNLTELTVLFLHNNHLSGSIPAALGGLTNMTHLYLSANQLSGSIPSEFQNFTNLEAGELFLNCNALYTTDSDLRTFLNSKQYDGDWESTQTLAPLNLAIGTPAETSVPLTWTAITYTGDTGGYEIYYATTSGGPYTLFETTADKTVETITVTGLEPETTYYFRLRTVTQPYEHNQNTVYSEYTAEVSATTAADTPGIPAAERQALIDLYNSTDGENWRNNTNWLGELGTECTWYGVNCNSEKKYVININLPFNQLRGSIPPSFGSLSNLTHLVLKSNQLTGTIPPELNNLSNLVVLALQYNSLCTEDASLRTFLDNKSNGWEKRQTIAPKNLAIETRYETSILLTWTPITYVSDTGGYEVEYTTASDGTYTMFGTTADKTVKSMRVTGLNPGTTYYFRVRAKTGPHAYNQNTLYSEYTDQISATTAEETAGIPTVEREALTDLYNNTDGANWTDDTGWLGEAGTECSWHGVTCDAEETHVTEIDLHENNLVGTIPASICILSRLAGLYLNNNQLTGSIPSELGGLSSLTNFSLHFNQLTGSIPPELGSLSALTTLRLEHNQLTGSIPLELGNLSGLTYLALCGNRLTGSIPPELGNLSALTYLWLHGNQLTGSIPSELGELSGLRKLYLNANHLTGTIPPELGSLSRLERLYLGRNQLSGNIPEELKNLSSLQEGHLFLSYSALYTTDDSLRTFLNAKENAWETTQTLAPENLSAGTPTKSSVPLAWAPLSYAVDSGGYEVEYSMTSGEPYGNSVTVADKTQGSLTLEDLTPGTTYHVRIRSFTDPHDYNANTVYSEYTDEISATTQLDGLDPLNAGLIAFYPFNGNADDKSGNENHGVSTSTNKGADRFGNLKSAYCFDGVDDRIDLSSLDDGLKGLGAFTASAWVINKNSGTDWAFLVQHTAGRGVRMGIEANGDAKFGIKTTSTSNSGNSWAFATGSSGVSEGEWALMVLVWDGAELKGYVNGILICSAEAGGTFSTETDAGDSHLYLGYNTYSDKYFKGYLDDIRIYGRAISESEIRELYEERPRLVGHWNFDEGSGDITADSSGEGNDGTIVDATWADGKTGGALDFKGDGTGGRNRVEIPGNMEDYVYPDHFTVMMWINVTDVKNKSVLFHSHDEQPGICLNDQNQVKFNFKANDDREPLPGESPTAVVSDPVPTGQWVHVAATWNGSEYAGYVCGKRVGHKELPSFPLGGRIFIGQDDGGGERSFDGLIDDVRIYNYAVPEWEMRKMGGECQSAPNALIAHWNFNKTDGDTVIDSTGNGHDGTVVNHSGNTWQRTGDGVSGGGLDFTDGENYVSVPDDGSLTIMNAMTVSAWVKLSNTDARFVQKYAGTDQNRLNYSLDSVSGHGFEFHMENSANNNDYKVASVTQPELGVWYHLTGVYDGETIYIYVGGIQENSLHTGSFIPYTGSANLILGTNHFVNDGAESEYEAWTDAIVDEVRIYNYAISQAEIKGIASRETLYEDGEDGTTDGWSVYDNDSGIAEITNVYDEDRGSRVIQLQGNAVEDGYKLLNEGGTEFANTTQFIAQWSMKFDNDESYIVYWMIETDCGGRQYMEYRTDFPPGCHQSASRYISCGLPMSTRDGTWHNIVRDLYADVKEEDPNCELTEVNRIYVRGSGRLDDIKLSLNLPDTPVLSVTPVLNEVSSSGGTLNLAVANTGTGAMRWTAESNDSWLIIDSGASGTDNGTITVSYEAFPAGTRVGTITVAAPGAANSPQTIEVRQSDGLIAYYPFNGNANDESGNDNHGMVNGATLTADINGNPNSAYSFDGADDYIQISHADSLNITVYTLSAWIKSEDTAKEQGIISKGTFEDGSPSTNPPYHFYVNAEGKAALDYETSDASNVSYRSQNSLISENIWHLLTVIRDSSDNVKFYMDGQLKDSHSGTSEPGSINQPLFLGIAPVGNGIFPDNINSTKWFHGSLDDIRIYNRAISEAEIGELYEQRPDTSRGLVAHYEFEGNANDSSGNENHGAEYGGLTYESGITGQAASFDGVDDFIEIEPKSDVSAIGDFTISAWTYLIDWKDSSSFDVQYVFNGHAHSKTTESDFTRPGFNLQYDKRSGTGKISNSIFYHRDYHGNHLAQNTQINMKGEWHHNLFMRIGDKDYTYFDGQLLSSTYAVDNKKSDLLNMQHPWFIGTFSGNNPNYHSHAAGLNFSFYGFIDDLRIYDRGLSEAEIQEIYEQRPDVSRGLVAYYPFNGNANDETGNGHDGTINGDPEFVDGLEGKGLKFDGDGDYIQVELVDSLKFNPNFDSFTLVAWAKPIGANNPDGPTTCDMKTVPFIDAYTYHLGNKSAVGKRNSYTHEGGVSMGSPLWDQDNWHLFVGIWDVQGTEITASYYLDGNLEDQENFETVPDGSYPWHGLYIGATRHCSKGLAFGEFYGDEIRIYNRAISPDEIQELYEQGQSAGIEIHVDTGFSGAGTGGPASPYNTISQAIANASDNSVIRVAKGTYMESPNITDISGLSIQGGWSNDGGTWTREESPDPSETVISPSDEITPGISLSNAAGITVTGFALENGIDADTANKLTVGESVLGGETPVSIANSADVIITACEIQGTSDSGDSGTGVLLTDSSAEIDGNFISSDSVGVSLTGTSTGGVTNNAIHIRNLAENGYGIKLESSDGDNIRILNNVIFFEGGKLTGISETVAGTPVVTDNQFFGDDTLIFHHDADSGTNIELENIGERNVFREIDPYVPCAETEPTPCYNVTLIPFPPGPDTDADGLPDDWEEYFFDDIISHDGTQDDDGDGLSGLEEFIAGTSSDTSDADADGLPDGWDTDADGMPDGWEVGHGLSPLAAHDADEDRNDDGESNLEEYLISVSVYVDAAFIGTSDGSADAPCRSISEAIVSGKGRRILAAKGVYTEALSITDIGGLSIQGGWSNDGGTWTREESPDPNETVISPSDEITPGISLSNAAGITVTGFALENGIDADTANKLTVGESVLGGETPVSITNSADVIITACEIQGTSDSGDSGTGVILTDSSAEIDGNFISSDNTGIRLTGTSTGGITNNAIHIRSLAENGYGIKLESSDSDNIRIVNNVIFFEGGKLTGIRETGTGTPVVTDNQFFGDDTLIFYHDADSGTNIELENIGERNVFREIDPYVPCAETEPTPCYNVTLIPFPPGPDTDADGLPDDWEEYFFDDIISHDGTQDDDGDGLSDLEEFIAGTSSDTSDADGDGLPDGWDTDADGMPDGWEMEHGLSPLAAHDADADRNDDGESNLEEYLISVSVYVDAAASTGGDGLSGSPYQTVSEAVMAASSGALIRVAQGDYPEAPIVIADIDNLTIEGGWNHDPETRTWTRDEFPDEQGTNLIAVNPENTAFDLENASNILITGFSLKHGVSAQESDGLQLIDNVIGGDVSVHIKTSEDVLILENKIVASASAGDTSNESGHGIIAEDSDIFIENNRIQSDAAGIYLKGDSKGVILANVIHIPETSPDAAGIILETKLVNDVYIEKNILIMAGEWQTAIRNTASYTMPVIVHHNDFFGTDELTLYEDMNQTVKECEELNDVSEAETLPKSFGNACYPLKAYSPCLDNSEPLCGKDADNDGLPDEWEIWYCGDAVSCDVSDDDDEDGLTHQTEYEIGTNPKEADTDDDGFSDKWETDHETDPRVPDISGLFRVGESGLVGINWLFDGGMYEGEMGIFRFNGMEAIISDSPAFIAEAARRAMSNSDEGHIVLSDGGEGAQYNGDLRGEPGRNEGAYHGMHTLRMMPGDKFGIILVPNATLATLSRNPSTTTTGVRPLFSLAFSNPDYGMHVGQVSDINGVGNAFVFEDQDFEVSDKDYNDFIFQLGGVSGEGIPVLESLSISRIPVLAPDVLGSDDLGGEILAHLDLQTVTEDQLWISVVLSGDADLMIYDPEERECGRENCRIPGARFESHVGRQIISLPALKKGDYRILMRSAVQETCSLSVRGYEGYAEIASESSEEAFTVEAHQVLRTFVSASLFLEEMKVSFEMPRVPTDAKGKPLEADINGDGRVDDVDIEKISSRWNTCEGEADFDAFYDRDDDGCVTVSDIMKISGGKTWP